MKRQKKHIRMSKKGKKFVAGRRKRMQFPVAQRKQIIKSESIEIQNKLKNEGRARIPDIGILKLKRIPAQKGGKKIMMFGKEIITKSKPARKKIKFTASKALKEAVGA